MNSLYLYMSDEWMMLVLRCAAGVWCVWLVWMLFKAFSEPMDPNELGREKEPSPPEDHKAG